MFWLTDSSFTTILKQKEDEGKNINEKVIYLPDVCVLKQQQWQRQ